MLSRRKVSEIMKPFLIEVGVADSICNSAGISTSGEFVNSQYFSRLKKLGDFDSATTISSSDAYHYPYLDFGISQIHGKLHYVTGIIYSK